MPGQCFRCVVRCLFDLWNCIAHRHGEANAAHNGKIRKIIAYIGDNRIGYSCLANDFFVGGHLQCLFHINELHVHFVGAPKQCRALTSGYAASAKAGSVSESEALTIVRIKGLDFEGDFFGLGEQDDATIASRTQSM